MRFFRRKKEDKETGGPQTGQNGGRDDDGSKEKKKNEDKEMSFLDHAEELRKRIIVVLIVFAVAFIPAYIYHKRILDFLTEPLLNRELVFLEITEPFLVNIKLAFFAAAAVAIPVLVYQIVVFVKPALSQNIRKNLMILTTVFFVLFAGGVAFSYFLLIPVAVNWLLGQGEGLNADV